jgi:dihydroflavonol-4-reductase
MILVTGATGHLGNVLVRELVARGEKVRALFLPGEDRTPLENLPVEMVEGNVLKPETLRPAFEGIDRVYHLAGVISIMPGRDQWMRQVNVVGTQNVIRMCREMGVKRLVYTSSIHALERPPHGVTIDESLKFDAHNPAGEYDRTKAEASIKVLEAVDEGLDAVLICPTGVIGPHDYRGSEMGNLILEWMSKKVQFIIDGMFDFVDVRDIARGQILAGEKGRSGETYILSGERISLETMLQIVQGCVGIRAPRIKVPIDLARFAAYFTPLYYRITRTTPRFTPYSIETVQSNSAISNAKARKELGFSPLRLSESLTDTVAWWLQRRKLAYAKVGVLRDQ